MPTRKPPASVGDRLILPDGREFTVDRAGIWGGADRFEAFRHVEGKKFEKFEGVDIGLVWDEQGKCWRYPSAKQ